MPESRWQVGRAPLQVFAEDPRPGDPFGLAASGTRSGNVERVLGPGKARFLLTEDPQAHTCFSEAGIESRRCQVPGSGLHPLSLLIPGCATVCTSQAPLPICKMGMPMDQGVQIKYRVDTQLTLNFRQPAPPPFFFRHMT